MPKKNNLAIVIIVLAVILLFFATSTQLSTNPLDNIVQQTISGDLIIGWLNFAEGIAPLGGFRPNEATGSPPGPIITTGEQQVPTIQSVPREGCSPTPFELNLESEHFEVRNPFDKTIPEWIEWWNQDEIKREQERLKQQVNDWYANITCNRQGCVKGPLGQASRLNMLPLRQVGSCPLAGREFYKEITVTESSFSCNLAKLDASKKLRNRVLEFMEEKCGSDRELCGVDLKAQIVDFQQHKGFLDCDISMTAIIDLKCTNSAEFQEYDLWAEIGAGFWCELEE